MYEFTVLSGTRDVLHCMYFLLVTGTDTLLVVVKWLENGTREKLLNYEAVYSDHLLRWFEN